MMALDPKQRYQTSSQLLDAVRARRLEAEGKSGAREGQVAPRSVFIAESDEHLQNILRDRLKSQGYRVLLAGDPVRAWDRFRQYPFEGLIVDARTTGEEGFRVFAHIVEEANRRQLKCAAVLLLGEEQIAWKDRLPQVPHLGVLTEEISFKTVSRKLKELMEEAHGPMVAAPPVSEDAPARRSLEDLTEDEDGMVSDRSEPPRPVGPRPIRHFQREAITVPVVSSEPNLGAKGTGLPTSPPKKKTKRDTEKWTFGTEWSFTQVAAVALVVAGMVLSLLWLFFSSD
jgi:CheY-like chemotaxis protein